MVETLGDVPSDSNTAVPRRKVKIVDCGVNDLAKPYDLTEDQIDSTKDL